MTSVAAASTASLVAALSASTSLAASTAVARAVRLASVLPLTSRAATSASRLVRADLSTLGVAGAVSVA